MYLLWRKKRGVINALLMSLDPVNSGHKKLWICLKHIVYSLKLFTSCLLKICWAFKHHVLHCRSHSWQVTVHHNTHWTICLIDMIFAPGLNTHRHGKNMHREFTGIMGSSSKQKRKQTWGKDSQLLSHVLYLQLIQ